MAPYDATVWRLQRCVWKKASSSTLAIFGLKYRFVGRECGSLLIFNERLFIHSRISHIRKRLEAREKSVLNFRVFSKDQAFPMMWCDVPLIYSMSDQTQQFENRSWCAFSVFNTSEPCNNRYIIYTILQTQRNCRILPVMFSHFISFMNASTL